MMMHSDLRGAISAGDLASELKRVRVLCAASRLGWRRAAFVGPVAGLSLAGGVLAILATPGADDLLRLPLLALLVANLFYMALVGWPGVLGFFVQLCGRGLRVAAAPSGDSRTAVVLPVYNEDPHIVFAAVEAMARAVSDAGMEQLDFFVLSDTQDPAIAAAEIDAYAALLSHAPPGPALHYRRRVRNTKRKAGNIAEFCSNWGERYDYMVVLDADSLMSAEVLSRLVGLMDANPRAGIIQTVPHPVGRETLFARIQQFAARLYSPLLVEGLTFWQQADGNYWGHNAIIRIAPFVAHCELPVLPGREPFGGEILCHDVVEAGLMRAAGWEVWVLPEIMDSFETLPANLLDYASRERRWCQGNLQHLGVVARPGFLLVGRFHLGYGVTHYISGALIFGFLALATLDVACGGRFMPALLGGTGAAHTALLLLTLGLLYAAKLLALGAALADPAVARQFGGRGRLLASAAAEQAAAIIAAPILPWLYVRYIWALVRGRAVRWDAQPRDDRGVSWQEGWKPLRGQLALGVAWLGALALLDRATLMWATPVLGGLLLAVPVAILTSRTSLGLAARRLGLFLTPEEVEPSAILRGFQRALRIGAAGERLRLVQASRLLESGQLAPRVADGD